MTISTRTVALAVLAAGATAVALGAQAVPNVRPKDGYVPNAATAVAIAEAVLIPIYGEAEIAADRPYRASLADGVWRVSGTLPPNTVGGTAVAMIAKDDGRIVRVFHEQ